MRGEWKYIDRMEPMDEVPYAGFFFSFFAVGRLWGFFCVGIGRRRGSFKGVV